MFSCRKPWETMEKAGRTSPAFTIQAVVEVPHYKLEVRYFCLHKFNLAQYLQPYFYLFISEIKFFLTDGYTLHKHLALVSYPEAYTVKMQSV